LLDAALQFFLRLSQNCLSAFVCGDVVDGANEFNDLAFAVGKGSCTHLHPPDLAIGCQQPMLVYPDCLVFYSLSPAFQHRFSIVGVNSLNPAEVKALLCAEAGHLCPGCVGVIASSADIAGEDSQGGELAKGSKPCLADAH